VGGSVEHDHQQVLLSNVPYAEPPATVGLGELLLRDATPERIVDRVGDLALTLVPSFMRRPLHAFIVPLAPGVTPGGPPRAQRAGWLHHLPEPARDAFALALARLARAVSVDMERRNGEPAWNMILHTGPGCGPLLELRPFTQPLGGFEQLGCTVRGEAGDERGEVAGGAGGLARGALAADVLQHLAAELAHRVEVAAVRVLERFEGGRAEEHDLDLGMLNVGEVPLEAELGGRGIVGRGKLLAHAERAGRALVFDDEVLHRDILRGRQTGRSLAGIRWS
jgi:hypothetical protein